jgi:DNA-binding transcriptional regulator YiaG
MSRKKTPRVADRIRTALREVHAALSSGRPIETQLTTRVVKIPTPKKFSPKAVRELRGKMRVSQGVFAEMVGVSRELVEGWEQGVRKPQPLACRLLEQLEQDPQRFMKRLVG